MHISPTKGPLTPTTCKTWGPLRLAVPPLPLGEGCDFDFYPSPRGRGGTARRWVRGLFHPPSDFDGTLKDHLRWPRPGPAPCYNQFTYGAQFAKEDVWLAS